MPQMKQIRLAASLAAAGAAVAVASLTQFTLISADNCLFINAHGQDALYVWQMRSHEIFIPFVCALPW